MEKENVQEDLELEETTSQETDNEQVDNTQEEETDQEENESVESYKARVVELEQKNKELFARLKREEKKPLKKTNTEPIADLDLFEFFSQGGSREDYEQLQVIMRGKNLSMAEAKKDVLFEAYLNKKSQDKKSEQAQLNSRRVVTQDTKFKTGQTREEHKKAWLESIK